MVAAELGLVSVAKALLLTGIADVTSVDKARATRHMQRPRFRASHLDVYADAHWQDGWTPLMYAARMYASRWRRRVSD